MKTAFFSSQGNRTPSMLGTAGLYDSVQHDSELVVSQLVNELMVWFPSTHNNLTVTNSREQLTHWEYELLAHPIGHDDVLAYLTLELQSQIQHESC
jgi:hypothetical protein